MSLAAWCDAVVPALDDVLRPAVLRPTFLCQTYTFSTVDSAMYRNVVTQRSELQPRYPCGYGSFVLKHAVHTATCFSWASTRLPSYSILLHWYWTDTSLPSAYAGVHLVEIQVNQVIMLLVWQWVKSAFEKKLYSEELHRHRDLIYISKAVMKVDRVVSIVRTSHI